MWYSFNILQRYCGLHKRKMIGVHRLMERRSGGRRIIAVILSVLLTFSLLQGIPCLNSDWNVWAEQVAQITPGVKNVNVRQQPTTASASLTKVHGGQALTILDQPNQEWYHVRFRKDGTTYTGYVYAEYVSISDDSSADGDFEAYMTGQGFPESYKPYLRDLHAQHPNWKFVAVQTGLDWNTVIENERNKQGQIKNLIYGTSSAPHYNWRETGVGYNWRNDKWSPFDGTTWFAASKEIVAYYIDPRTYLYETYIFAFEQLSYDGSVHNAQGVEAILAGSFMYKSCPRGESRTFSTEIMEAGAACNVSPYHLASRMRQEMGRTAGVNATGTSPNYPGIFNFFNVGSVDSAGGGAVNKGLAWAARSGTYGRPWNTAYKAIAGGAEFIGSSYINKGQDTLYTQKFNVTNRSNLFGHQYMSNIQAPATEARNMCNAYRSNGLISSPLVFKIPVYQNMPETAVEKPADSGSPNNWLNGLAVSGCTLTPSFNGGTTEYSLIVGNEVDHVTVTASTVHAAATVSGIGEQPLNVGKNVLKIRVVAQNGDRRTYHITIIRKDTGGNIPDTPNTPDTPDQPVTPDQPDTPTLNTTYRIQGNYISGVAVGTQTADFIKNLGVSGGTATLYQSDGKTQKTSAIATGDVVKIVGKSKTLTYTVIIYGDVSGDGEINALDLLKIQKHIIGAAPLTGPYLEAGNVKRNGDISALDLLKVQKHIIGASKIEQ